MKITGIGICPPTGAASNPKVTPELLASSLARYSRSNKGLDAIFASIDWTDTDKSVDSIFKFVDYGHASITGMTGGIAVAVDGLSMFLAYKIFEIAQLCDGQESSTRYIKMDKTSVPSAGDVGIPERCAAEWERLTERALEVYREIYDILDDRVKRNPDLIKLPDGIDQKVVERLRKNYALDRARYLIPFASKTNAAYVMTARVWADTVRELDSLPYPEAKECAGLIRGELDKFVPRMTRHSFATDASKSQADQILSYSINKISADGVCINSIPDDVYLQVQSDRPAFLPNLQTTAGAFAGKKNRYSTVGTTVRRAMVRAAWNNMAIAELRDLNRHRSGYRFSPLCPVGFYLPEEARHPNADGLLKDYKKLIESIASQYRGADAYVYALLLGTQVAFEHSTHLDKFIYEIELRTGMGAHFRYAEHLSKASALLIEQMPELAPFIQKGNAEPEF
ncbi:MAG: FAD-dependent thymidylate synthase [Chitinispirillia bacterium]|nr:FAD-dependent thymidylate synthase [Chitinispirillia bacterium]MCL2242587.1 FAD-dependent thymidylate synthase [Chitinispirillia bacterium]